MLQAARRMGRFILEVNVDLAQGGKAQTNEMGIRRAPVVAVQQIERAPAPLPVRHRGQGPELRKYVDVG